MNGCAIQEVWKTDGTEYAVALKACDDGKPRDGQHCGMYSWGAAGYHQLWEGRQEDGQWRLYREWMREGQPVLSRTYWTPIPANALEKIVEQSRDGGRAWSPPVQEKVVKKS